MRLILTPRFAIVLVLSSWSGGALRSDAQSFLERLEQRTSETIVTPAGKPRGYLGLRADDVGQAGRGVRVTLLHPGGAAQRAGISVGDLISAVDRRPITNLDDLSAALDTVAPGDDVRLQIERDDQRIEMVVTLTPRLSSTNRDGELEPVPAPPPNAPVHASLGVTVESLSARGKRQRGVEQGVLVTGVRKGSAAERHGLSIDAVILTAAGISLEHPANLERLVRQRKPGDRLELTWRAGQRLIRREVILAPSADTRPRQSPTSAVGSAPAQPPAHLQRLEASLDTDSPNAARGRRRPSDPLQLQLRDLMVQLRELKRRLLEIERQLEAVSSRVDDPPVPDPQPLPPPTDS